MKTLGGVLVVFGLLTFFASGGATEIHTAIIIGALGLAMVKVGDVAYKTSERIKGDDKV